jgi:signal transduction histidine kinase
MELPIIFKNIAVPFEGEVKMLGSEYLVISHAFPEGNFYIAKSLNRFEEQEERAIFFISILTIVIMTVSLLLAFIASRLIANPIIRFSNDIKTLETSKINARIKSDFLDAELNIIANAINIQLDEIEAVFKRERALLAMASHELRTPIAVILGAANVIESRNQLHENDKITLQRIIKSANEMSSNVQALLSLVRKIKSDHVYEKINPRDILNSLHQEYGLQQQIDENRLVIVEDINNITLLSDSSLVKILLHNIIYNALNHASGAVTVYLHKDHIEIVDRGLEGISSNVHMNNTKSSTGLGMYIVKLICEHIDWRYDISTNESAGTTVKLYFN